MQRNGQPTRTPRICLCENDSITLTSLNPFASHSQAVNVLARCAEYGIADDKEAPLSFIIYEMRNEEQNDENKITRHLSQNWQTSFALRLIRKLGDLWVITSPVLPKAARAQAPAKTVKRLVGRIKGGFRTPSIAEVWGPRGYPLSILSAFPRAFSCCNLARPIT